MTSALRAALHPLAVYQFAHDMDQREAAAFFKIKYGSYRKIVRGHTRVTYYTAELWEVRSGGELSAVNVMRWQQKNAPLPTPTPKPRRKRA